MKCPKCGSKKLTIEKRIDGYCHCLDCGWNWKPERKQPALTTAEMLLWLAENESIDIWHTAMEGIIYVWRNGNAVKFKGKALSEAIKQAYDWAKQEVTK